MTIHSYARCQNPSCGEIVDVETADDLLEIGWLTVAYGPEGEDSADFCSVRCAVSWLQSDEAREILSELAELRSEAPEDE